MNVQTRRLTEPLDDQAVRVGQRLRTLRRAQGLTLQHLAAATDLSHGFLSLVERGRTRPNMPSFTRITRALGTTPVDVLIEAQNKDDSEPTSTAQDEDTRDYGGVGGRVLHEDPGIIRVLDLSATSDQADGTQRHDDLDEVVIVLTGELEVTLPNRIAIVAAVQSLQYPAGTEHNWRAKSSDPVRMIMIHYRPGTGHKCA